MNSKKWLIILMDIIILILTITTIVFGSKIASFISQVQKENFFSGVGNLSFKLTANPEEVKVKAGDTVTIELNVSDIHAGKEGINSIVGNLKYDENLFDSMKIEGVNNWNVELNQIKNHPLYGKFCIYTVQEGVTENEQIVKMTLKLKNNLKPQETYVHFLNLESSDGEYAIREQDRKVKIIIYEDELPVQPDENVQTGDTATILAIAILIITVIINLLLFINNKKVKIISISVVLLAGISAFCIHTFAYSEEIQQMLEKFSINETWLSSSKYLVTDTNISRIAPNTSITELKNNLDKQVTIYNDSKVIQTGKVVTGLKVKSENENEEQTTVVVGDMDKDGDSNQVELTTIIRNVIDSRKWNLTNEKAIAADINIDNEININDVKSSVKYIVYGEMKIPEVKDVKAPTLEIIGGTYDNELKSYTDNVVVKITENEENAQKTMYKIEGTNNQQSYTEIKSGETVTLTEEGTYKISAYTYGELGNRSKISSTTLVISKKEKYSLIVHHYIEGTTTKVAEDETIELTKGGSYTVTNLMNSYNKIIIDGVERQEKRNYLNPNKYNYISGIKDENIVVEGENGSISGSIQEQASEIIYYYSVNKYKVTGEVIGLDVQMRNVPQTVEYGENLAKQIEVINKEINKTVKASKIIIYSGEEVDGTYGTPEDGGEELIDYEETEGKLRLPIIENITENKHIVVIFEQLPIVAKIIGVPKGSEEMVNSDGVKILNNTYHTLNSALVDAKIANKNEGIVEILILADIKNESCTVENKNNVIIDLNGYTINSNKTVLTVYAQLIVKDTSAEQTGKIISKTETGIYVKTIGSLTLGINEEPISITSPYIQGLDYGIYKEKNMDTNEEGIFNFYDGKIVGNIAIGGNVDDTPLLYNSTVTVQDENTQVATLAIVLNAEARIGRTTYLKLEQAIEDAGTRFGKDGSQVEITVLRDLTKENVVIDNTKNILLDLNGYTVTTTGEYIIDNQGKLEIVDKTAEESMPINTLTKNGTYYFEQKEDGSFVSNNKGIAGIASSYATIDLSDYEGTYVLSLEAGICSEYGDYGYATITNTDVVPEDNSYDGRFVYVDGVRGTQYYEKELTGGSVYYLHLGYRKNKDSGFFNDEFIVKNIKVTKKNTGTILSGGNGALKNSSTGTLTITSGILNTGDSGNAIDNYGICNINGGEIIGKRIGIINNNASDLTVNNGLINTTFYSIFNDEANSVTVNGGIIQTKTTAIYTHAGNPNVTINNGVICGNSIGTPFLIRDYPGMAIFGGEITINNGYISGSEQIFSEDNIKIYGGKFRTNKYFCFRGNVSIDNAEIIANDTIYYGNGIKEDSPEINIKNVNAKARYRVIYDGKFDISGGSFEIDSGNSTAYGMYNSSGTYANATMTVSGATSYGIYGKYIDTTRFDFNPVNILSGEIISKGANSTGIFINAEKPENKVSISIGTKDGTKDNDVISIKSVNGRCLDIKETMINYYDGTLIGKTGQTIEEANINEIENNYDINIEQKEDGLEYVTLENISKPIAKISKSDEIIGSLYTSEDENYYYFSTLKSAIESCKTGIEKQTTIYVESFSTAIGDIVIPEDKNIKIELNGNTITVLYYNTFIINNGVLEISDSSKTIDEQGNTVQGTGKIIKSGGSLLKNTGTAVLDGGRYEINGLRFTDNAIENTGTLSVNSLIIMSNNSNTYGIYNTGKLNVNDIEFNSYQNNGIYNNSNQDLTITGKISNTKIYNNNGNIYIKDNVKLENWSVIENYNQGKITISNIKNTNNWFETESKRESNCMIIYNYATSDNSEEPMVVIKDSNECIGVYNYKDANAKIENSTILNVINKENGIINIDGSKLHEVSNEDSGTINVVNTTVTSNIKTPVTQKGNEGKINIISGKVIGNYETAISISSTGSVTLGEKGGVPSKSEPSIFGKTCGIDISNEDGKLYYYDGIIEGYLNTTTNEGYAIKGAATEKEDEYEIVKTKVDGRETVVLDKVIVAKNLSTGKTYGSLQSAFADAENNNEQTIELLKEITMSGMSDKLEISENKNIILDLKGYEINVNTPIVNNGTLKLTSSARVDTDENEEEVIIAQEGAGQITNNKGTAITDNGTLNINSVTIQSSANGTANDRIVLIENSGILNVNGGILKTTGDYSTNINNVAGNVTINSGSVLNTTKYAGININSTGEVTINNGDLKAGLYGINGGNVNINGGTITIEGGRSTNIVECGVKTSGIVKMTEGTIKIVPNGLSLTECGIFLEESDEEGIEITGGTIDGEISIKNYNTKEVKISNTINGVVYNESTGTITIEGNAKINNAIKNNSTGIIYVNSENAIINNTSNSVVIDDSNMIDIDAQIVGIVNQDSGKIIVEKGTIKSGDYGIINLRTGIIEIGTNNETVSLDDVTITGNYTGILNSQGKLNYYDGTIAGENAVKGAITNLPNNKEIEISKNENIETYSIGNSTEVASITIDGNTTKYNTLNEAVVAVPNSTKTTIKLLKDVIIVPSNTVTIEENKDIVLDLNGKEIRCHVGNGSIINNGKLEITDSIGETSEGKIYGYGSKVIVNNGHLILTSAKIYGEATQTQRIIYNTGAGTLTLNGGKIESVIGIRGNVKSYNIYTDSTGEINLNDGEIKLSSTQAGMTYLYGIYINNTDVENIAMVKLNGSNITGYETTQKFYYPYAIWNQAGAKLTILQSKIYNKSNALYTNMDSDVINTEILGNIYYKSGKHVIEDCPKIDGNIIDVESSELDINNSNIKCSEVTLNNNATVNIYDSQIEGKVNIPTYITATLNMYGGKIINTQSNGDGILLNSDNAILNLYGGKVEGNGNGIYIKCGTAVIGNKEYPVSTEQPEIVGGQYGLKFDTDISYGTFNMYKFYDGVIKGTKGAIFDNKEPTDVPKLYDIKITENGTVAKLEIQATFEQVAKVNGSYFNTLQEAIKATNTGTIEIEKDIVLNNGIVIGEEQDITIDLKGHTMLYAGDDATITNNGTLTVIDSSENASIENLQTIAITNNGILKIGTDDETVSANTPVIRGNTYGIENTNGNELHFYDGIIEGITGAVNGIITKITSLSGYSVKDSTEIVDETITYLTKFLGM